MDINFTNIANSITDAVGRKAADYRDSVHSAYRVYELQSRIKDMMKQGNDLGACITALVPNAANADEVAEKLLQGVNALEEELQKEDYDWRTELNRILADKNEFERGRYLINLIHAFDSFYNGDVSITAAQAERFNSLVDADAYTVDDIRFLTDVLENQIEAHSEFLAHASVKVMQPAMDKLSPEVIDKIMEAYQFDAVARAVAFYVAQQTGELHVEGDMNVSEIPPEMLGQMAAAQTEASKMMLAHWKFGVMVETLKHDVKRIISAMFHYVATHIEDWARFLLSKSMFFAFAVAVTAFIIYLFPMTPLTVIVIILALADIWLNNDFDEAADIIVGAIRQFVDFIRRAFAKPEEAESEDEVYAEAFAEETEGEDEEEAEDEDEDDEEDEEEDDEEDEAHA